MEEIGLQDLIYKVKKDAILARAMKDERVRKMVESDSVQAFVKEDETGMVGEPD